MKRDKKLLLNWDAFDEAILGGAHELQTHEWVREGRCPGIYGIPRGGLCVAVALSHYLELPMLMAPQVGCIVVDDLIQTGATMRRTLDACNRRGIADRDVVVWAWVTKDRDLASRYYRFIEPRTAPVFPWEDWLQATKGMLAYEEAGK